MTPARDARPEDLLDAYLDGLLSGEERTRFESALGKDPRLREELERQRAIDEALARALGPPSEDSLRAVVAEARRAFRPGGTATSRGPLRFPAALRPFAVAAALALLVCGSWLTWSSLAPRGRRAPYAPQPWRSMETVYRDAVADGFNPGVVCRDGDEFETWFRQQFQLPLRLVEPLPAGVAALGLDYSNTVSPATIYVLAEAEGERIIVFVDRSEFGTNREPAPESGLSLYRSSVGGLSLYELSPLAEPRLLPHFFDPAAARSGEAER